MFTRFTPAARRVVVLAQEQARGLRHNYIGTEHLLLGVLAESEGVGAQALQGAGITLDASRAGVEQLIGRGQKTPSGHVPFTPRSKKVLELALRESHHLGHNYIGTEHILLGLLREGQGVGAQVIAAIGTQPAQLRASVLALLDK
jgi:ATP-dependent Clp protease ATP-binding subunit ClpC